MSIVERLQADMKAAMRAKEQQRLDTIRMALAAIKNARIDLGREPDEADTIKVIQQEVKRRRDSATAYRDAQRPDLAGHEEAELAILDAYLPQMLDAAALRPLVAAVIGEVGATGMSDLSKVMRELKQRFRGQAEDRTLSEVARELLAG